MRQAITTFIIIAACILGAAAIIGAKSVPPIDYESSSALNAAR
jgi:hypothetical protein